MLLLDFFQCLFWLLLFVFLSVSNIKVSQVPTNRTNWGKKINQSKLLTTSNCTQCSKGLKFNQKVSL